MGEDPATLSYAPTRPTSRWHRWLAPRPVGFAGLTLVALTLAVVIVWPRVSSLAERVWVERKLLAGLREAGDHPFAGATDWRPRAGSTSTHYHHGGGPGVRAYLDQVAPLQALRGQSLIYAGGLAAGPGGEDRLVFVWATLPTEAADRLTTLTWLVVEPGGIGRPAVLRRGSTPPMPVDVPDTELLQFHRASRDDRQAPTATWRVTGHAPRAGGWGSDDDVVAAAEAVIALGSDDRVSIGGLIPVDPEPAGDPATRPVPIALP